MLDASRRLAIASLAMGIVLLVLVVERIRGYQVSRTWLALELVSAIVSFALAIACRRGHVPPKWLPTAAVTYELLLAFTLSYMEFSVAGGAKRVRDGGISWACLVIVLFPALVPATPARSIGAGFAAATMGPLAYLVAISIGEEPTPLSRFDVGMLFLDNYIAGALAVVPSLVFTKLVADVAEARDVGSYTLEERLGVGGMGEVWRARHRLLARPAAVKLIRPEALGLGGGLGGANALARFEREARATVALRSPHTVVLYDFGSADNGAFYYVMELLDGLDVESIVERFGPLPTGRAIDLLQQACASLEEAHQAGLVHRDVKPANIYVCRLGTEYDFVKLLDFGLVKTQSEDGPEAVKLSSVHMVYGTPAYMAPEQARGDAVSARTDIYALGCVAYYMLTGAMVFDNRGTALVLIDHVQTVPRPPSARIHGTVPPELESLVMACLEKAPEKRPQSAREVAERLRFIGLSHPWSQAQAEAWWDEHAAHVKPSPTAATAG